MGHQSPDSIDSILGGEDGFKSPIDLTSRTPSHIRSEDVEPESNQLALIPLVTDQLAEKETKLLEAFAVIRYLEEQMRNSLKTKDVLMDVPEQTGIIARQHGEMITSGIQQRLREVDNDTVISSDAVHLFTVANTIGGSNLLPVLYEKNLLAECAKVNMLGWNNFPTSMTGGYHEGSNEIMLALYKLNEVIFKATVVYPMMIFNQEAQKYEYKENAFMTFNPSHKNKQDKPYGESGFYRSNIVNISEYFSVDQRGITRRE